MNKLTSVLENKFFHQPLVLPDFTSPFLKKISLVTGVVFSCALAFIFYQSLNARCQLFYKKWIYRKQLQAWVDIADPSKRKDCKKVQQTLLAFLEKPSRYLCLSILETLSEFPKEIFDHPYFREKLKEIEFDKVTHLVSLEESLGNFLELEKIVITNCPKFSSFSSKLGMLKKLREISTFSCENFTEIPESVVDCPKLEILNFNRSGIISFPDFLYRCLELKTLKANECQKLSNISDSLGKCPKLEKLIITKCPQITAIPDSVWQSTSLEYLNLSSSNITSIPDSLKSCQSLTDLYLEDCKITELPDSLKDCPCLKTLCIAGSDITFIRNSLNESKSLRLIDMRRCLGIKALPLNLVKFKYNAYCQYTVEINISGSSIQFIGEQDISSFSNRADHLGTYIKSLA